MDTRAVSSVDEFVVQSGSSTGDMHVSFTWVTGWWVPSRTDKTSAELGA